MFKLSLNSSVPIYEQIVDEISKLIEINELKEGDSLPTIRSLASQLDIAVNTVARAYQELENLNLIVSSGRKGSFVKKNLDESFKDDLKIFKTSILKLIRKGHGKNEIERIFNSNLNQIFD